MDLKKKCFFFLNLRYEGAELMRLNEEQKTAVENILSKTDKLPFVLFGPPGTGKTRTLVAAIEQIVITTKQHVLVCAMSNSACDEIAERLLKILQPNDLYRLYAKSYGFSGMDCNLKEQSNWSKDTINYPSLKYLYKFRVVICTLAVAGCFVRSRIDKKVWKSDHFDYVFIDECASAPEPMTLIPIAGILFTMVVVV